MSVTDTSGASGRAKRVLLHVGVPKTATTAVQTCMARMRDELRDLGVLYPRGGHNHIEALRSPLGWDGSTDADDRRWKRLVRAVREFDGVSMISGENAAVADTDTARRIVDELGGEQVEVIITLRPLETLLASSWQQEIKMNASITFGDWLDHVIRGPEPDDEDPHRFWTVHQHDAVARTWMSAISPERLHLVVVDPSRPIQVFDVFDRLLGLPPGTLDPSRSARANRSLTWAEAETLRRVNEMTDEWAGMPTSMAHSAWRASLTMIERRQPSPDEPRIAVPATYIEAIRPLSRRLADGLRTLDADVIGDLDDLCPSTPIPTDTNADGAVGAPTSVPLMSAALLLEGLVAGAVPRAHRTMPHRP